jgi:hypothetical protein
MEFGLMIPFIDHLYTQLVTILYSSLFYTHTSALSLIVSTSRFLVTASNNGDSSASALTLLPAD